MQNVFKQAWNKSSKETKKSVIVGFGLLSVLIALEVYATYLIPEWRKFFYNVIENKDKNSLSTALMYFVILMSALIITQSLKQYIGRTTALNIRTSLTKHLLKGWVKGGELDRVDNPSQRINQDCQIATDSAIKVWIEVIISSALVIMLIFQSRHDILIVSSSIIYTLVISLAAVLFKKPLINTEILVQKAEADHRQSLSKISLGLGDFTAKESYDNVLTSVKKYLKTLLGYNIFSATQNQMSILVPWAILSIPYFNGDIKLGEFMGGVAIFELIVINSTILVSLFPDVTRAQASWVRIKEFNKSLTEK